MIIGPILNRSGGYCFDIWTAAKGVSLGYTYRRIEDAYYDRKLTLEASRRAPTLETKRRNVASSPVNCASSPRSLGPTEATACPSPSSSTKGTAP
jgi:hypothetical protein